MWIKPNILLVVGRVIGGGGGAGAGAPGVLDAAGEAGSSSSSLLLLSPSPDPRPPPPFHPLPGPFGIRCRPRDPSTSAGGASPPPISDYSVHAAKMANMNITTILEKRLNKEGFKADQDIEPKLTSTVLQQLEDTSGEVSGLAVKCLAPLVKKVGEDSVVEMTNILCDKLLNGKDQ
uniref:Uncharacterized protein n=1 Tax=Oryza nivara TaxID=4536 RepID=A0A0E0G1Z4_ORYNI